MSAEAKKRDAVLTETWNTFEEDVIRTVTDKGASIALADLAMNWFEEYYDESLSAESFFDVSAEFKTAAAYFYVHFEEGTYDHKVGIKLWESFEAFYFGDKEVHIEGMKEAKALYYIALGE